MSFIFPTGRISKHRPLIVFLFLLLVADFTFIFLNPAADIKLAKGVDLIEINIFSIFQGVLMVLILMAIPVTMLIRNRRPGFRKFRHNVRQYTAGLFLAYLMLFLIIAGGKYFFHLPLISNPLIPVPIFLILLFCNHFIYDIKRNNFRNLYIFVVYAIIFLILQFIPVYYFDMYFKTIPILSDGGFVAESAVIFLYLLLVFRTLKPLRIYITRWKFNTTLKKIDQTLVPVNELNRINENSSFWRNITNDNFQGLKNAIGVQSAYFILYDRKENGYNYTYGYGPELSMSFIDAGSEIIKCLSEYKTLLEKSDLLFDHGIDNIHPEVLKFLDDNEIDVAMPFMNMADTIIGFLLLGRLKNWKPYTRDILDALEIYRIKLQSLLITGLILDEVTAEQVSEHDRLVVTTVKKKIIPEELDTVKGIRLSSLNIGNSDMGGDYYDSVKLARDRTAVFMADLSYNGVDSALLGLELYSMVHSRSMIFNFPEKMLNMINQVLGTSRITSNYARCCSLIISSDGNYMYSNASFNPVLIFDHDINNFTEIESSGIPAGIEINYRYSLISGRLKEDCIAIIYSDGLFSSCNSTGETYSREMLLDTVKKHWRETPAVIIREIYDSYRSFTENTPQINDVSLVLIKKVKTDA